MKWLHASAARGRRWRRVRDDDRGIVASVIIIPVIVLALWLTLQAAFVMHARNAARAAAQDAAVAAAADAGDPASIAQSLFNDTVGSMATLTGVNPAYGDDQVTVTVTANVIQVTPFNFSVSESASSPIEVFIPQSQRG